MEWSRNSWKAMWAGPVVLVAPLPSLVMEREVHQLQGTNIYDFSCHRNTCSKRNGPWRAKKKKKKLMVFSGEVVLSLYPSFKILISTLSFEFSICFCIYLFSWFICFCLSILHESSSCSSLLLGKVNNLLKVTSVCLCSLHLQLFSPLLLEIKGQKMGLAQNFRRIFFFFWGFLVKAF